MPRTVAIVFEPDFSSQLEKLAFHTPVWVVDTPANRAAAEDAWREAVEWPHITVTLFRPPAAHASKDDWRLLLDQIGLRERFVEGIDVIGSPLTLAARAVLSEVGYIRFDETTSGFRAKRI